jgi:uncharacterized protein (DUF2236 family)
MLWPIVFARPEVALEKSHALWNMHRAIKGVDKNGKKYHSLDPEAYGWVHGTGLYTAYACWPLVAPGVPLTQEIRQQLFEEWRQMGQLMGLQDKNLPKTQAEYWEYFHNMINERLEGGAVMEELLSKDYHYNQPKPPGKLFEYVPDFLWRQMLKPAGWTLEIITRGTLPPEFRRKFNVRWTRKDERRLKMIFFGIRQFARITPEKTLTVPLAWRAKQDAKQHPEAFVV